MPLHHGISHADYLRMQAVSSSVLGAMLDCPARANQQRTDPPPPIDEMTLGTALHAILLSGEPYAVAPGLPRNTKIGKQAHAQFQAELNGRHAITVSQAKMIEPMRAALKSHPVVASVMSSGLSEVTATWTDEITGLQCRARPDLMGEHEGWTYVCDLKTMRVAAPWRFGSIAAGYGYHIQAAHYLAGLYAIAPRRRRFLFLCAEKEPPYLLSVNEFDVESMAAATERWRHCMSLYADCAATGRWPGYGDGINACRLPKWELGASAWKE